MTHAEANKARRQRASQMAELRKQGMTLDEIGQQFGISRQRVEQLLKFARVG